MSRPFQFSIRFLLVATVAVAAATAVVRAELAVNSALAIHCLSLLFGTAAVLVVTQTTGKVRTFWIGAAIVLAALAMYAVVASLSLLPRIAQEYMTPYGNIDWRYVSALWFAAPLNGLFAVFLHWLFEPREDAHKASGWLQPGLAAVLLAVFGAACFFAGVSWQRLAVDPPIGNAIPEAEDETESE